MLAGAVPAWGRADGWGPTGGGCEVVSERGREFERRTTGDLDELLYWVFAAVTFSMAADWEVRHRNDAEDFRAGLFRKQLALLAQLSDAWVARRKADLGPLLRQVGLD